MNAATNNMKTPDKGLGARIVTYGRMIKFSHTIFALPFALAAVVLAHRQTPVTLTGLTWILIAMIAARSTAMGFNRIVDAAIDARNPRTAMREIPAGKLSRKAAVAFVGVSGGVFILAAAMLGKLCLQLSVPVLVVLCLYSYTKRFTWLAHIYLGFAISLAPLGAWIALTNSFHGPILLLCLALMSYIAGFDILYACQDTGFDRQEGLFSIPARFGIRKALIIARGVHLLAWSFLLSVGVAFNLGLIYYATVLGIGGLLVVEHRLVNPDDLSKIDIAFFNVNSTISVVLFLGILIDEIFGLWKL
jgi:4-hydroxybenzoate polyprenyltransferase